MKVGESDGVVFVGLNWYHIRLLKRLLKEDLKTRKRGTTEAMKIAYRHEPKAMQRIRKSEQEIPVIREILIRLPQP